MAGPERREKIKVDEHEIIRVFALQPTTAMTMPSASIEPMALLEVQSFGGQQLSMTMRYGLLRDLSKAIDGMLKSLGDPDLTGGSG